MSSAWLVVVVAAPVLTGTGDGAGGRMRCLCLGIVPGSGGFVTYLWVNSSPSSSSSERLPASASSSTRRTRSLPAAFLLHQTGTGVPCLILRGLPRRAALLPPWSGSSAPRPAQRLRQSCAMIVAIGMPSPRRPTSAGNARIMSKCSDGVFFLPNSISTANPARSKSLGSPPQTSAAASGQIHAPPCPNSLASGPIIFVTTSAAKLVRDRIFDNYITA